LWDITRAVGYGQPSDPASSYTRRMASLSRSIRSVYYALGSDSRFCADTRVGLDFCTLHALTVL